jgi:hypothetical protein
MSTLKARMAAGLSTLNGRMGAHIKGYDVADLLANRIADGGTALRQSAACDMAVFGGLEDAFYEVKTKGMVEVMPKVGVDVKKDEYTILHTNGRNAQGGTWRRPASLTSPTSISTTSGSWRRWWWRSPLWLLSRRSMARENVMI